MTSQHPQIGAGTRAWTIGDIAGISRIEALAIQGGSHNSAYILKEPCRADGRNHYALFVVDDENGKSPRKLVEAQFLADLRWRPGTDEWSVRGDFGSGVELYSITPNGAHHALVTVPVKFLVGGNDGVIQRLAERPRRTGVVSYDWAPDGLHLWYSRLRSRSPRDQRNMLASGIIYDDETMSGIRTGATDRVTKVSGLELRVLDVRTRIDRPIAFVPQTPAAQDLFRQDAGSIGWVGSNQIQFRTLDLSTGPYRWALWRINITSRAIRKLAAADDEVYGAVPSEAGYITVRRSDGGNELLERGLNGELVRSYGVISGPYLDASQFWRNQRNSTFVGAIRLHDRDSLFTTDGGAWRKSVGEIADNIGPCAFNTDLSYGICGRESLSRPPEVISIGRGGREGVLARPNARYDKISPLRSEWRQWTNRYGNQNDGYVTFPRNYRKGQSYPAIVITHSSDARNLFASDAFQWEFPAQVFAERGYFVLSVNEPSQDFKVPPPNSVGGNLVGVEREQFAAGLNPAASLEAAVEALVSSGDVDPTKVGIAGYSRGGVLVGLTISHSRLFAVASIGDSASYSVSSFWSGQLWLRSMYVNLFGGSPFDPNSEANYQKFSTSERIDQVRSPVLQQFAGEAGEEGLELEELLKAAAVPSELVYYPNESHLLDEPSRRVSAMTRNLEWFEYWLRGRED
jgi:hypothetical protein